MINCLSMMWETRVQSLDWEDPWVGKIPGLGRSPGEGNGNPLQYSCIENSVDGGAWWATVRGVAESQTRVRDWAHTFVKDKVPAGMWVCL